MNLKGRLEEIKGKKIWITYEEGGRSIGASETEAPEGRIVEVGDDCILLTNGDVIPIGKITYIEGAI